MGEPQDGDGEVAFKVVAYFPWPESFSPEASGRWAFFSDPQARLSSPQCNAFSPCKSQGVA